MQYKTLTSEDSEGGRATVVVPESGLSIGQPFTLRVRIPAFGDGTKYGDLATEVYFSIHAQDSEGGEAVTFAPEVTAGPVPGWTYETYGPSASEEGVYGQTGSYMNRDKPARSVDVTMTATLNKAGTYTASCTWGFNDNGGHGIAETYLEFPLTVETATAGIVITTVSHKGQVKRTQADEYIEIANQGTVDQTLTGWKVNAGDAGQDFVFPELVLWAGQSCRVYTNEIHPESGGFSFGSGRAIWNDKGDTARLYDADKTLVATFAYGDQAPTAP